MQLIHKHEHETYTTTIERTEHGKYLYTITDWKGQVQFSREYYTEQRARKGGWDFVYSGTSPANDSNEYPTGLNSPHDSDYKVFDDETIGY
jgi:hypothetical protein